MAVRHGGGPGRVVALPRLCEPTYERKFRYLGGAAFPSNHAVLHLFLLQDNGFGVSHLDSHRWSPGPCWGKARCGDDPRRCCRPIRTSSPFPIWRCGKDSRDVADHLVARAADPDRDGPSRGPVTRMLLSGTAPPASSTERPMAPENLVPARGKSPCPPRTITVSSGT
jgi:hypothetical protein